MKKMKMAKSSSSKSKKSTNMITKKIYGHAEIERDYGRMTFGRALAAWRQCEEQSVRAFAKILGMSASTLSDLETGRRIPSTARAAAIAKKLNHPPESWVIFAINDDLHKKKIKLRVTNEAA